MNETVLSADKDAWKTPPMQIHDVITQLHELADDRKSFFSKDGGDETYRADYTACVTAAKILEQLFCREDK